MARTVFFFLILFYQEFSLAVVSVEVTGFTNTDSFVTTTETTGNRSYFAGDLLLSFGTTNKDSRFYGGFHVNQLLVDDRTTTATNQLNSVDMGPILMLALDSKRHFTISAGYNVVATAIYTTATSNSEWLGTGYFGSIAYIPEVKNNWHLGARMTYHSATYTRSTTSGVATDVSYSRTFLFPAIVLAWRN